MTANPSTEVKGNLETAMYSFPPAFMQLKYTLEKINYAIAAQRNPEFMLLFTT
jgi:hypothetical protein